VSPLAGLVGEGGAAAGEGWRRGRGAGSPSGRGGRGGDVKPVEMPPWWPLDGGIPRGGSRGASDAARRAALDEASARWKRAEAAKAGAGIDLSVSALASIVDLCRTAGGGVSTGTKAGGVAAYRRVSCHVWGGTRGAPRSPSLSPPLARHSSFPRSPRHLSSPTNRFAVSESLKAAAASSTVLGVSPPDFAAGVAGALSVSDSDAARVARAETARAARAALLSVCLSVQRKDAGRAMLDATGVIGILSSMPLGTGTAEGDMVAEGLRTELSETVRTGALQEIISLGGGAGVDAMAAELLGLGG